MEKSKKNKFVRSFKTEATTVEEDKTYSQINRTSFLKNFTELLSHYKNNGRVS